MIKGCIITVLIFIFGCGQQQPNYETLVASTLDSLKTDTISQMSVSAIQIRETDTVIASGHKLMFQATDSIAMTDIFGDAALRTQMTDTIDNWHQRAIFIEKYLGEKFKIYFSANDSTLILFLANNKQLQLPKWDNEQDAGYNFEHYFASIDYYLLHVQYGEGNGWMLVNRKNGFKKNIIGEPYISPDGKRILTVNSDLIAGYSENGIELFSISGDTLKTEFQLDVDSWGATGAKWLSDKKVIIEKEYFNSETGDINNKKKYSVLTID